jgi:hypothetical protein
MDPVDGYAVEEVDDRVRITLSNRYGEGEIYLFPVPDARAIAMAILEVTGQGD